MQSKSAHWLRLTTMMLILLLAATLSFASAEDAKNNPEEAPALTEVREKVGAAAESISSYTAAQRDQAAARAQKELSELDRNTDLLGEKINRQWNQLSEETREQWQDTFKELKKKRVDAAEWYGGVKRGSVEAWEEIKKGYVNSYSELEKAWQKARREFNADETDDTGQKK